MLGTRIKGYWFVLQLEEQLIRGLETTGLKIKPNFEETILKEMAGAAEEEMVDFDTEMPFSGKTYQKDGSESWEDFETLRELAFAGTNLAFVYGNMEDGETISGTGVITDFGEDANSKDTGTFSGTFTADKGSISFSRH
jgi:hypothetical protein